MDATLSGIEMDVKEVQPWNAAALIDVTPSGIVIDARDVQPEKTFSPIDVIPEGNSTETMFALYEFQGTLETNA